MDLTKSKMPYHTRFNMTNKTQKLGRDDRIRTCDNLVPNQAFYRTELHLEIITLYS